jgi:SAM-dependent methyltransferase
MPNTDVAYQMVRNGILPVLDSGTRVLEMGTGSGVVVAMMADATRGIPGLQFVGTDIDPQAVRVSRQMLQGFGNVEIREGDLFEPVMGEKFDVIFWNPPWFSGQWREKTYGVKMVDEHYATVLRFLNDARNYLKPGGRIFMLFPVNYFKDDIQTKISYKFGDPMSSYINGKGLEIGLFEYDPMGSKRSGFSAMPKVSRKVVPVKETPDTMRSEARTASVVPEVRLDINPLVAVAGVDATKVLAFMKIEGSNLDKLKADMTRKGQEGLARERDEFDRREVELEKQFSVAALPKLLVQFFERYGMTEALAAEISSQVVLGGIGTGFVDIRAAGIRGLDAEKIQRTTNAIYDLILKMPGSGVPMIVNNGEDSAFVLKALRKIEIPRLIVLYDQKHPVGRGWNVFPVVSKYKFSERKSANALVGDVIKGSDGKALMAFLTADLDIEQRGILSILADFTNTANPDLKELVCAAAVLINRIYASASPMDQGLMKVNPGMLLAKLKEKGIDLLALSAKSGVLVMSMQTLAQEFAARTEIDKAA